MKINSKHIFIVDGIGAIISAFLLGIVLTKFEYVFGMPKLVLQVLSLAALIMALHVFVSYFLLKNNWSNYLKVLAIVNIFYCCATIVLVIYFFNVLTVWGLWYFIIELIVVLLLSRIEMKNVPE